VKIEDLPLSEISKSLQVNVTSTIHQTTYLLNKYMDDPLKKFTIVNMSSLAALKPFDCWSLYCVGKAARDQFFKVLALETLDKSKFKDRIRVLNYAPGPCNTRMKQQITEGMPNVELRNVMNQIEWIPVDISVKVLIEVLIKNDFENGAHLDYYDIKAQADL
jgi:sepiapterin reductase